MLTRRHFLQTTALAAGALVIGFRLDVRPAAAAQALAPNAFIRIAPDNTITIISKHTELGQGSYSGLATILAEEMDADWGQIRVEAAPADAKRYGNRLVGGAQLTGGSTAMAEAWDEMRRAGATARAMLVDAAAKEWGVPAAEITVADGVLSHPGSGRRVAPIRHRIVLADGGQVRRLEAVAGRRTGDPAGHLVRVVAVVVE